MPPTPPQRRPAARRRPRAAGLLPLAALLAALLGPAARGQGAGESVVWGQNVFVIPYQWAGGSDRSTVREVILYLSDDHGANWREVTRARPDVQSFMYRAPADGEYWFAIRTADLTGRAWPEGPPQPELRVVVDTRLPRVQITSAQISPDGTLTVDAQASDPHLEQGSVEVSYQHPATGAWVRAIASVTPGLADTVTARATAALPPGTRTVMVRATVKDKAGNPASAGGVATAPYESARTSPFGALLGAAAAQLGQLGTPARGVSTAQAAPSTTSQVRVLPPAPVDPFTSSTAFVPPTRVADSSGWQAAPPATSEVWRPDNEALPSVAAGAPQRAPASSWPSAPAAEASPDETFRFASSTSPNELPRSGASPPGADRLLVNSDRFELQYDLHSVGMWGVSKVEVWGTEDRGASWRPFAIDTDQRSPVDVQAPADGVYGFAILVQSVGGLERLPPRAGDQPDLYVEVDRARPTAQITSATQPDGYFADHLNVTWQASDANLEEQPISLLYAAQPSGPWMPIASNLPNNGRYAWRLQRHLPDRLFVRLEARDRAGNVGVDQTTEPVVIRLPESTGQVLGARPLQ